MATFTDDFNRADGTNLGAGWVEVTGDWTIASNQLTPGTTDGTIVLRAAVAMASSDHYAQVTIAATTSASQGVWCRGNTTITTGYLWRNNGSNWTLFAVVADTFTSIGSYSAAAVAGDVAKIQAVGSTIKAFVNGIERVSVVNTAVTTGTSVGIRSEANTGLRYDVFTAADVSTSTALGIAAATEAAQLLTGTKATGLGVAAGVEQAQALAGAKTGVLATVQENTATQPLTGAKTALLATVTAVETAQALTGATSRTLDPATAVETALPLAGAKAATLGPALEASTARPLTSAGSVADDDVDITVGVPHGAAITVGRPHGSGWKVGTPW
ncbi:hypothetical protein OG785_45625 [Streptomyces sp. NBC_00006]|uniref:hypothetical protein n=1 Tax=Streptomyces sp. NBC_00006 TaxID=2975619 RepID=UPI00224E4E4F|nr:hypothetical protein [Streptomyces sp. NBC_00006]MCX5537841.1 hypothetical protein [Streptomyces sp. NBC_00006]